MQPWSGFYSTVTKFHTDNGMTPPSEEQVEAAICAQLPKGWCTEQQGYIPPAPRASGGCKGCGRW